MQRTRMPGPDHRGGGATGGGGRKTGAETPDDDGRRAPAVLDSRDNDRDVCRLSWQKKSLRGMGTRITASTYLVKISRVLRSASARKKDPLQ